MVAAIAAPTPTTTSTASAIASGRRFTRFLLIISAERPAGARRLSPGATPDATIACSLPRALIWTGCLGELAAIELVDDRRAVALEDRLGRAPAARRERGRWRCGPPRSCPDGSSDRSRRAPGRARSSGPAASRTSSRRGASTEMRSIVALNSRPGIASMRIVASWPTFSRPRSDFVEPRFEVHRRQVRQLHDRRAGPGAIAFVELTSWPPHVPLAR